MLNEQITIRKGDGALVSKEISGVHATEPTAFHNAQVIVNADDWGRDCLTTDRTHDCFRAGTVSSVSAMVFMADSERAAVLANERNIDAGLHLNFTMPYSMQSCPPRLKEHQHKIARTLTAHRFAAAVYQLRLTASFEYVVQAQLEEYERLYGAPPARIDGHDHRHLCANVLCQELLPHGCIVRRNLTFSCGEKIFLNRLYRRAQDHRLARRHRLADYFYDLHPVEPAARLRKVFALGARFNVEIQTHPIRDEEYRFLMNGEIRQFADEAQVAKGYLLRSRASDGTLESLA